MGELFAAFPSWFLRIECDRCGKVQMVNEVHAPWADCSSQKMKEKATATIAAARVRKPYQDGALGQHRRFVQGFCI